MSADAPPLRGPVLMNQDWVDLAHLHWAVDPARVAPLLPRGTRPDELDGATYVGLIPFSMVRAGPGRGTTVPWLGTFLETNVRLYSVDRDGRRGVVFVSLDASRLAVVLAARAAFAVPYRWATMTHEVMPATAGGAGSPVGETHRWRTRLRWPGGRGGGRIEVRVGAPREASAVDAFVADRWRLHTRHLGRTWRVPNEHGRWPLHDAELLALEDTGVLSAAGFGDLVDRAPDQAAFSRRVHTRFGLPQRVG